MSDSIMTHVPKDYDYDHRVTGSNTVKHWVMYALDAWEAENPEEHREQGARPEDVWELASDDSEDSIVFRGCPEVRTEMKRLFESREALDRRSEEEWYSASEPTFRYRLSDHGRKALLELGVPEYLPNRRDPEFDRELPMEPVHEPGWWLEDDERPDFDVEPGWQLSDNDWVPTDHDRVFYYDAEDIFERGEMSIVSEIADAFPECTFVITMGPYRMHDIAYRIRDPFNKVVQLDIYSPAPLHRTAIEIDETVSQLVRGLHHGLESQSDLWEDE